MDTNPQSQEPRNRAPPLPPRAPSIASSMEAPPPYSSEDEKAARSAILLAHAQVDGPSAQNYSLGDEKAARASIVRNQGRSDNPPGAPSSSYSFADEKAAKADIMSRGRTAVINDQWRSRDPRSSSTQSLAPSESGRDGRRTLLNIFIHGFMGNETSFQSFPAHLHNRLTITLAETHVVHTKIYPRYKSRKAIEFARDDFSKWLEPHESSTTDVILLGHSMGGLLAAEVVLMSTPSSNSEPTLKHRILGTISFDTPFLGMHPGVIISGIGSLFRPAAAPPGIDSTSTVGTGATSPTSESQLSLTMSPNSAWTSKTSLTDTTAGSSSNTSARLSPTMSRESSLSLPSDDPNYNPPFVNDVRLSERSGWGGVLHFINKHSDGLTSATKQYFMSHIEFGGCLADYPGLKNRYARIRSLEDVDEHNARGRPNIPKRRVRFINLYTASTGIPKKPKNEPIPEGDTNQSNEHLHPAESSARASSPSGSGSRSGATTPRISVDAYDESGVTHQELLEGPGDTPIDKKKVDLPVAHTDDEDAELAPMQHIDSMPIPDDEPSNDTVPEPAQDQVPETLDDQVRREIASLPELGPIPPQPEPLDLTQYSDQNTRKLVEDEHRQKMKDYKEALKNHVKELDEREKYEGKLRSRLQKEADKKKKEAEKAQKSKEKKEQKEFEKKKKEEEKQQRAEEKERAKVAVSLTDSQTDDKGKDKAKEKPKRDKKFCMLPPDINGKRDPTWVRVYMEGVDEVGAHCGLFFSGPQYEGLVADVGERVEEWVREDASKRELETSQERRQ